MALITKRQQSGFTLLEMIVVVTIITILSAVALPKLADVQSSALLVKLDNMEGIVSSGTQLIYTLALAEELTDGDQTLVHNGTNITLHSGYPIGFWTNGIRSTISLDNVDASTTTDVCSSHWCGRGTAFTIPGVLTLSSGRGGKVWPKGYTWNSSCGVYYINLEDGSPPTIGTVSSGC